MKNITVTAIALCCALFGPQVLAIDPAAVGEIIMIEDAVAKDSGNPIGLTRNEARRIAQTAQQFTLNGNALNHLLEQDSFYENASRQNSPSVIINHRIHHVRECPICNAIHVEFSRILGFNTFVPLNHFSFPVTYNYTYHRWFSVVDQSPAFPPIFVF